MNPFQLLQMFKNSSDPMMVVQQLSNNNPQMQQLVQNLQGKNPQELEQFARNVAQSKGIDIRQFLNQYGISVQ